MNPTTRAAGAPPWPAWILSGLLLGWPAAPGAVEPTPPANPPLDLLSHRASLYEKAALGFNCEETVIVGKFEKESGESRREVKTRYDYLYEGNPEEGYREIRILVAKNGSPRTHQEVELKLNAPDAYSWALLFTDRHRSHFRFQDQGEELVGFHIASVIGFAGAASFGRGREIEEWSGKVWVDRETGNFLKISATPNRQDDLLPLRQSEWLKGLRIGGVPVKRQPRGYRYQLSFTVEKFGLTFPGEAATRVFVLDLQGQEEIRERISQKFRNYVFFNVHSEEDFAGVSADPGGKPVP